jgi:diguanylate cyclase
MTNPTDIARETLKTLSMRRVAPTPESYEQIYHEIAGTAASVRPPRTSAQAAPPWGNLLRDILRELDRRQSATSSTRKREGLERLLINFNSDPLLFEKLQNLQRSWAESTSTASAIEIAGAPAGTPSDGQHDSSDAARLDAVPPPPGSLRQLRDILTSILEHGVAARLDRFPDLAAEARDLKRLVAETTAPEMWLRVAGQLKNFWLKIELRTDSETELIDNLLRVLGLLTNNLAELVDDDQWVVGQIQVLHNLLAEPPTSRGLQEAERNFKEIIFRQGTLKHSLKDARETMKDLVSVFVQRLTEVTASTTGYHEKIAVYSTRIRSTDDMLQLKTIIDELMEDTKVMQVDMLRSRDELEATKRNADEAQARVKELEQTLTQVSEQVREDALTGMLNRRGLSDAFDTELARSERSKKPLCVAVLDLDNFKKLNDTHGHQAGDDALVHLARVVKHTVRPTDVIARYGGEEFIVIYADTELQQAIEVTERLQRELTKRFFLHDNERLLITFSAGVAERQTGEAKEDLIGRADKAMYQAKSQGKNRVMPAV